MGLRAGLDWRGKPRPTGIRSPDRPARRQSLYRLSYLVHGRLYRPAANFESREKIQRAVKCVFYRLTKYLCLVFTYVLTSFVVMNEAETH